MGLIRGLFNFIISVAIFLVGLGLGAYIFTDVQSRNIIETQDCKENCFSSKEFLGLLGSIGVQKFGSFLPNILKETDKTIAFTHPFPEAKLHYIIVPKKDIKNIGELGGGDESYLTDIFAVMNELILIEKLEKYKIVTNGPGYQTVGYLHFHLLAN